MILVRVQALCDYGFPATGDNVCYFIKCYLDTKNRRVEKFNINMPRKDYMFYFLRRHKDFTKRIVSNIKRARAAVNEATIRQYS